MQYSFLLILVLLFISDVNAQVYKWVDQHGNIQYTDQPPSSAATTRNEKKLNIKTPPSQTASTQTSARKTLEEKMQAFRERRDALQKAEVKQQTEAADNNRRCVNARGQLKIFQESPRLTFPDGKGGVEYADDEMRQRKISEARKNIATYCL